MKKSLKKIYLKFKNNGIIYYSILVLISIFGLGSNKIEIYDCLCKGVSPIKTIYLYEIFSRKFVTYPYIKFTFSKEYLLLLVGVAGLILLRGDKDNK